MDEQLAAALADPRMREAMIAQLGGASSPNQRVGEAFEDVSGMVAPGNLDLGNRPKVQMPNGIGTIHSMSFGEDGREVVIPTITPDGRVMTEPEAIDHYRGSGQHLGMFSTPEQATRYGEQLSQSQGVDYGITPAFQRPTDPLRKVMQNEQRGLERLKMPQQAPSELVSSQGPLGVLGSELYDRSVRQWWRQPDRSRVGPFPTSMRETAATPPPTEQRQPGLARLMLQAMSPEGLQIPPQR